MFRLIKEFKDGSLLEYGRGAFDEWCIYMTEPSGKRKPPKDTDYFGKLKYYASKYGAMDIYNAFLSVYEITGRKFEPEALDKISLIAAEFGADALGIEKIFAILYTAMIAEENKANSKLGKRIKRLGIHKLLVENEFVMDAANFMRGMNWRDIDVLCRQRGF